MASYKLLWRAGARRYPDGFYTYRKLRTQLAMRLNDLIKERKLTQTAAAGSTVSMALHFPACYFQKNNGLFLKN